MFAKKTLFVVVLSCICGSCKTLTEGQSKNVRSFAEITEEFAKYPSTVSEKRARLHVDDQLLRLSRFTDGSRLLKGVQESRTNFLQVAALTRQVDLSLDILREYARLLLRLSSNAAADQLTESTATLSENLTGLVAQYNAIAQNKIGDSAGSGIAAIVQLAGTRYIKNRLARALKKSIPVGNTILPPVCRTIAQVMSNSYTDAEGQERPGMLQLIENDSAAFIQDYNANIIDASRIDFFTVRLLYDRLSDIERMNVLSRQCIAAAGQLVLAHQSLTSHLQARENIRDLIKEVRDLVAIVQQCRETIQLFHPQPPSP